MPRPHEDIEHHTAVDHRPGGDAIDFSAGQWCAVEVAHVEAARVNAALSTYETLIEKARTAAAKIQAAAILRSADNRRVVALMGIDGHEGFRHIRAAWDDHHLTAEHHNVAESTALALYQFAASAGAAAIDPASTDVYAFEHVARGPQQTRGLIAPVSAAPGFRGALIFGSDDATSSAILYRFSHAREIASFRASSPALNILGPIGASGETMYDVHPVKTFL